tara:strand:- start:264 stop:602 length:339 start_codon:yes stop_codon:yes gene_type:complete
MDLFNYRRKRIDINDLYATIEKNGGLDGMEEFDSVCAELKRLYKKEDELRYQADWDLSCEEMGHKVRCHTCEKKFQAGDEYITAYWESHCITIPDGRFFFCNKECEANDPGW